MVLKEIFDSLSKQLTTIYTKEEARAIALRLIEHYTKMPIASLLAYPDTAVTSSILNEIMEAQRRCLSGAPVQYVIGETEFYGHRFKVTEDVLIPRPETEELVDWIVKDTKPDDAPFVLDIGTGSGCISISLAHNLPKAKITAIDVSEKALAIAQANAETNAVHVEFLKYNILQSDPIDFTNPIDLIVSNPPYVTDNERSLMSGNVLLHEPHLALFVPNDQALLFYEAIIRFALAHLAPKGAIYVEINENCGLLTKKLFESSGFDAELRKDLSGRDRMIKATYKT